LTADGVAAIPLPWLAEAQARAAALRAHALLIHGPAGVGQFEFALGLARRWLCEHGDTAARPCGRCAGCHAMDLRQHPDFLLLVPAALRIELGWGGDGAAETDGTGRSKAKPSRDIRVDELRQAIAWSRQTASRGNAKVMLLHPAPAMNAIAANALLKTLEEPPGRLRLLLTANDPDALLPTIRSRCQRVALGLPARDVALDWLRAQGCDEPQVLLDAAGGRPLDALALRREGFDAERWRRLPQALAGGDAAVLAGVAVPRVVDVLQRFCHDAMLAAAGAPPRFFAADTLPADGSIPALAAWARTLGRVARHDEHPWQAPLLVEALVAEAARCFRRAGPPPARAATLEAR
jgi:DNA polymerase-3 subunit delta'